MSLKEAAQYLAAQGRGGDSVLVHMSPDEVRGLQAAAKLHGASMTINPHTGLPEAFSLKSLLPAIIGAGLMATGVGAPAAAMIVGGGTTLATGSLQKGLMAGLGAYGGAGLGTALAESGAASLASEAAGQAFDPSTMATVGEGAVPGATNIMGPEQIQAAYPEATAAEVQAAAQQQSAQQIAANQAAEAAAAYQPQVGTSIADIKANTPITDQMSAGFKNVISSPSSAWEFAKNNPRTLVSAFGQSISDALTPAGLNPLSTSTAQIAPRYRYNPGAASPLPAPSASGVEQNYFPTRGYTQITNDQAKQLYGFADGGMTYGDGDTQGDPNLMQVKSYDPVVRMARGGASAMDREPMKKPKGLSDMAGLRETAGLYASGGLSDLGGYSDGGRLLRGPGDGVSDSIPATIGNKQPARLADGEFVVPARIVSELGNGSTEAGARQLYGMMDRVQKARGKTMGKDRVAKKNNPRKMLPA